MILQFLFFKANFFPFFGLLILKMSKNTRSLLFIAGTCSLAFVMFSTLPFPLITLDMAETTFLWARTLGNYLLLLFSILSCDQTCHAQAGQIFSSPLAIFTHFYSYPRSIGPYLRIFLFYSWSKFRIIPLLVRWSLYQTQPYSVPFWYKTF